MRGAYEHGERQFFSRGQEEDPVRRAHARREQEARASTTNGRSMISYPQDYIFAAKKKFQINLCLSVWNN